jgi:hypothetical protein
MICPACSHLAADHSTQGCLHPNFEETEFCPCERSADEVSWLDALGGSS